ncbi:MAG: arylsulfotransferase family protein [Pseudomonadota bacterium]
MRPVALALLLAACRCAPAPDSTPDDSQPPDTHDTRDTQDTCTAVGIAGLSWRLHEGMESLVWVRWGQECPGPVHAEVSFDDGIWEPSPTWDLGAGEHERLVVGVPFGTAAAWRMVAEDGSSVDGEPITTGPAPAALPEVAVDVADPERWLAQGRYLLTSVNQNLGGWSFGTYWTVIMDRQGRPVWAQAAPSQHWTLFAQVSADGTHLLWDEATFWSNFDSGLRSQVHRTYLDRQIASIPTPGLHHAFVELPDHTLVWGSQIHDESEALVQKGPDQEDETVLWTCTTGWSDEQQGCESNGLFYAAGSDSFLYSFFTNDAVVEVDHQTGASLWWAGRLDGGYTFDPPESEYAWQHGVSYTDEGHLLVSTHPSDGTRTTLVREYAMDHDAGKLRQVWSYDAGIFASTNGDAWRLPNGNTLHLLGSAGEINEVTPAGEVVWHATFGGEHLVGRGELVADLYALVAPGE